ncbi:MAG: VWA domain-containing protein [Deltaproteobacteria bacterium]|nr:VWA domain-containing protein [Deltaproteobacteria bacterium]
MRSYLLVFLLAAAGCGADSAGGASSPDDTGGGGGNVSFGGSQDIGAFRAALDRGELPPANTLDANGFFNEHFNQTPGGCANTLCLTPGLSVGRDWLTGRHQATLQIAVNTNVDPSTYQRLPLNLVVVVDHSGSMSADGRLEKVKVGLHTLVDNLKPEDRLALISFDDVVTTDAPFTAELDRPLLHAAINRLVPRGATNLYGGLEAGFKQLGEYPKNERQNRVIFLSDGLATAGNTSRPAIMEMAKGWIAKGIGLTSIGVGRDFDIELMRGLAENGAGNYYFLEDGAASSEVFTEELDFFMSPLALDIKIEAIAGKGWTFDEVVGSRLFTSQPTKGSMSIPAVFLASRASQNPTEGRRGGGSMIFVHLEPTGDATSKVASLTISYRPPGSTERISESVTLDYAADPLETPADPYLSGAEMAERYAMYNIFLGLRQATKSYDVNCAAQALIATRANAVAWNNRHEDPDTAADLELMDQYLENLRDHGATAETPATLSSCPQAEDPYYPEGGYGYGDDTAEPVMMCSSSKGTAGWLVMLGAVLLTIRRRRR